MSHIRDVRHKIKIRNVSGGPIPTYVTLDGKPLKGCRGISYEWDKNEIPTFTFEMTGPHEIEFARADVRFSFAPETVADAMAVIRHEFAAEMNRSDCNFSNMNDVFQRIEERTGERLSEVYKNHFRGMRAVNDWSFNDVYLYALCSMGNLLVEKPDIRILDRKVTVTDAVKVLRRELLRDPELRKGFLASINSALDDYTRNGCNSSTDLAEYILDRLIGEEE